MANDPFKDSYNIIINEYFARNEDQQAFIELFNLGTQPVDISSWFLTNDIEIMKKFADERPNYFMKHLQKYFNIKILI